MSTADFSCEDRREATFPCRHIGQIMCHLFHKLFSPLELDNNLEQLRTRRQPNINNSTPLTGLKPLVSSVPPPVRWRSTVSTARSTQRWGWAGGRLWASRSSVGLQARKCLNHESLCESVRTWFKCQDLEGVSSVVASVQASGRVF
jgi:hypothetical protein